MKKMRKTNVITALALTVVMLAAMTGIAAAEYWVVGDVIKEGTIVPDATVTAYSDQGHANLVGETTTGSSGHYEINLTGKLLEGAPVFMHAKKDNAAGNATTTVVIGVQSLNFYIAEADIPIDVPEFATIAIPVAGILGLLFFFNHRKRRKE